MEDFDFDENQPMQLEESDNDLTNVSPQMITQQAKTTKNDDEDEENEDEENEDEDDEDEENDHEIEDEIATTQPGNLTKRKTVAWQLEKNFDSKEEAYAELPGNWIHVKEHITAGGLKVFHKCAWPKCPSKMYLYHISTDKISMLSNQGILSFIEKLFIS
jgi:hypothetical protein